MISQHENRNKYIPTVCKKKIRIDSDCTDKSFPEECSSLVHCFMCLFVFCIHLIYNEKIGISESAENEVGSEYFGVVHYYPWSEYC